MQRLQMQEARVAEALWTASGPWGSEQCHRQRGRAPAAAIVPVTVTLVSRKSQLTQCGTRLRANTRPLQRGHKNAQNESDQVAKHVSLRLHMDSNNWLVAPSTALAAGADMRRDVHLRQDWVKQSPPRRAQV